MRNIFIYSIVLSLALSSCAQPAKKKEEKPVVAMTIPVRPTGWVSDFDQLFTAAQVMFLDSIIARHEQETTNEITVVTYQPDSAQLAATNGFEGFSSALFNQWGVGKKEKNNGIGILISTNLRKMRIETGTGLSSKLTNEESRSIIDSTLVPAFRNNEQYKGVLKALQEIIQQIK